MAHPEDRVTVTRGGVRFAQQPTAMVFCFKPFIALSGAAAVFQVAICPTRFRQEIFTCFRRAAYISTLYGLPSQVSMARIGGEESRHLR